MITQKIVNDIAFKIIGCSIEVHKHLGPGLLESVYESCLIEELSGAGLLVKSQLLVPVKYKNKILNGSISHRRIF